MWVWVFLRACVGVAGAAFWKEHSVCVCVCVRARGRRGLLEGARLCGGGGRHLPPRQLGRRLPLRPHRRDPGNVDVYIYRERLSPACMRISKGSTPRMTRRSIRWSISGWARTAAGLGQAATGPGRSVVTIRPLLCAAGGRAGSRSQELYPLLCVCVCARARACVRACVRPCARARVSACVHACVRARVSARARV